MSDKPNCTEVKSQLAHSHVPWECCCTQPGAMYVLLFTAMCHARVIVHSYAPWACCCSQPCAMSVLLFTAMCHVLVVHSHVPCTRCCVQPCAMCVLLCTAMCHVRVVYLISSVSERQLAAGTLELLPSQTDGTRE